jgi:hypothetical protein
MITGPLPKFHGLRDILGEGGESVQRAEAPTDPAALWSSPENR